MTRREIRSWLMDMDGVLVHEEQAIPGADRFLANAARARRAVPGADQQLDLHAARPRRAAAASGLEVPEESIWTSALATAAFLEDQRPGGSAFVIGEAGLTTALHEAGYMLTERDAGLRRPRRDPHVLVRADHAGDPADRRRRPLHRHQPGRHRPLAGRPAARDGRRSPR